MTTATELDPTQEHDVAALAGSGSALAGSMLSGSALSGSMMGTLSGLIDAVVDADRILAEVTAMRATLIDQVRVWSELTDQACGRTTPGQAALSKRSLRAELAAALHVTERTAENLLGISTALVHALPATLTALGEGTISYRHAHILIDHTTGLDDNARAELERQALPAAATLTPPKFERLVRQLRERAHPETIPERHRRATENREVTCSNDIDGMAWLNAYLPAADAHGIYTRTTDIAHSLRGPDEPRTLTQLRADVLRDLLLDGDIPTTDDTNTNTNGTATGTSGTGTTDAEPDAEVNPASDVRTPPKRTGRYGGFRARVIVTVPVLTLLGASDEPGILDGYGPIDPDTARKLAATAPSFLRLLTHPETGAILSVGRHRYTVPADLRAWLQIRDGTCRFPGCNQPTRRTDIDHTQAWAEQGPSDHNNLAHLCRNHHTLKHAANWNVTQTREGTGTLHWTTPTGRHHRTEPATTMPTQHTKSRANDRASDRAATGPDNRAATGPPRQQPPPPHPQPDSPPPF